jgi:hypothetical protein
VTVEARVISNVAVSKVEIYVDGEKRETLNDTPFKTTLSLEDGKHTIRVKAILENGESKESGEVKIGVGGVDWDYIEPTPTPKPSPSPTPAATPPSED